MNRLLLVLMASLGLVAAQPAGEGSARSPDADQPVVGTRIDTTRVVPFFRPKVVMHQEVMIPKDPFLGGALSLLLPGTGQAYCGKWLKGIGFLAGAYVGYGIAGGIRENKQMEKGAKALFAGIFGLVGLTFHAWSVLDGVNTANAHNRQLLQ